MPVSKLDRSQLPLSYLDFGPLESSLPSGCPFHADASIFNGLTEHDSKLLLARLASDDGLYVIERAGQGIFVACRLRNWVKEDSFGAGMDGRVDGGLLKKLCGHKNQSGAHAHPTRANCPADSGKTAISSPKRPKNRKGVVARMSILPKIELQEPSIVEGEQRFKIQRNAAVFGRLITGDLPMDNPGLSCVADYRSKPDTCEAQHQPIRAQEPEKTELDRGSSRSVDDLFATQREILMETLYTSKTALAYFTKSTLARARAAFRSSTITSVSDLANFYRGRLLNSKKMDLKYRETIPKIVEDTILQRSSDSGRTSALPHVSLKRTSKRKRLGKDGLYAGEEQFVRTWWLSQNAGKFAILNLHLRVQEMQALLIDLRNRETQLQLLLILEILTLESRTEVGNEGVLAPTSVKREPDDEESNNILAWTPSKINKKRDLRPDLDILVDRLCIYQSVGIVTSTFADEAKNKNGESRKEVRDKLRDFCCSVILPFYLHKAPDLVKEVSRKLGGPDLVQKRPFATAKTASSPQTEPGTAFDTRRRSIPRRTLERVLSEEQSSRQSSPPVLIRSATAPLGGSCTLDSAQPTQRPSSRGSLQKSRSFANREVDLVASSKAHNAKQTKLANLVKQKEELGAAIHALKKPNRSLVGMEIMAEVEKTKAGRDTTRRIIMGKSSSDQIMGVQIFATPKRGAIPGNAMRKRLNMNGGITGQSEELGLLRPEEPAIPSSTARNVEFQASQPTHQPSEASTAREAFYSVVQQTPSRGSCKTSNPLRLPARIHTLHQPISPARLYRPPYLSLEATPSANRLRSDHIDLAEIESTPLRMTKSQRPVIFMPLKKAEVMVEGVFRDAPVVTEKAGKAMDRAMNGGKEASIYDSLGWDDDVDEPL